MATTRIISARALPRRASAARGGSVFSGSSRAFIPAHTLSGRAVPRRALAGSAIAGSGSIPVPVVAEIKFFGGGISWYGVLDEGELYVAASLAGMAGLSASAMMTAYPAVALSGQATGIGTPVLRHLATSAMAGDASMTTAPLMRLLGVNVSLAGEGVVTGVLSYIDVVNAAASLSGEATVAPSAAILRYLTTNAMSGASNMNPESSPVVQWMLTSSALFGASNIYFRPKLDDLPVRGTFVVVSVPSRTTTDRRTFGADTRFR